MRIAIFAFACALASTAALAAVDGSGASGFQVSESAHFAASPDLAYSAFIQPSRWWSPAHTYSHDAANLSLDAKAGGCWCEMLPGGGGVQHMTVVYTAPGHAIRLRGALGPLQGMGADGALTVEFKPAGSSVDVTMTYAVGGYERNGFAGIAAAVDGVLDEQLQRLKRAIESGSPEQTSSR